MIHLEILPTEQRRLWDGQLGSLPKGWVLYGGTAVALHLGHRRSVDFDFFSSDALDRRALRRACPFLAAAQTLQDEPDTLTVVYDEGGSPVKLSFFGGIDCGRVGEPTRVVGSPPIASPIDLLATKLATVTQRIEPRDYVDIAALIRSGLTIGEGIAAMLALYASQVSAIQSVKTLTWYHDGGLEEALSVEDKETLRQAALTFRPDTAAATRHSSRLD